MRTVALWPCCGPAVALLRGAAVWRCCGAAEPAPLTCSERCSFHDRAKRRLEAALVLYLDAHLTLLALEVPLARLLARRKLHLHARLPKRGKGGSGW